MKLSNQVLFLFIALVLSAANGNAQNSANPFSISGTMGFTYEGYGLNVNPSGSGIYSPRRPWNQLRFQFQPTMKWGKNFTLPFNFNFAAIPTNFAGPYSGFVSGGKGQTLGQWINNPMNNFGLNPKYKWAELLLGTQYLKYSDLSTGDIGIFGAGVSLHPGKFLFKFFTGVSQQGVNFTALPPPGIVGAYKRKHYMFQIGREVEGDHKVAFNFSKAKDDIGSVTSPPLTVLPQEGFTMSFILDKFFDKGWFMNMEAAQSFFTKDLNAPLLLLPGNLSFKPFIDARTSTTKDYAGQLSVGKKSTNFDISYASKYIGAGYQTTGYPFMQADHWDNTINTRFNAWKNKMNVTASVGQRVNNMSNTGLRATQFIGNVNWFTQFNERFSLNVNYNNFGFQTASGLNPYGIKNVSNDIGLSPTYTWSTTTMTNILTLSYNYSKYDERDVNTNVTTSNNTHTAILTYVPVFFNKTLTPDFSLMFFNNRIPTVTNRLFTLSSSLGMPVAKQKVQLRGQLQYTLGKLNTFTANNNIIASCNIDCKLNKKLSWNSFLSTNYFKYGDELGSIPLVGANYLESNLRTGLQYKF